MVLHGLLQKKYASPTELDVIHRWDGKETMRDTESHGFKSSQSIFFIFLSAKPFSTGPVID